MTEKEAIKILNINYPSRYWDDCTPEYVAICHAHARGFLEGLKAGGEMKLSNDLIGKKVHEAIKQEKI